MFWLLTSHHTSLCLHYSFDRNRLIQWKISDVSAWFKQFGACVVCNLHLFACTLHRRLDSAKLLIEHWFKTTQDAQNEILMAKLMIKCMTVVHLYSCSGGILGKKMCSDASMQLGYQYCISSVYLFPAPNKLRGLHSFSLINWSI